MEFERKPAYCRDCAFRASQCDPYCCDFVLITGRSRGAEKAGAGCTHKIRGVRGSVRKLDLLEPAVRDRCKKRRARKLDGDLAMDLYRRGLNDVRIAAETGVSVITVHRWRNEQRLPAQYMGKTTQQRDGA